MIRADTPVSGMKRLLVAVGAATTLLLLLAFVAISTSSQLQSVNAQGGALGKDCFQMITQSLSYNDQGWLLNVSLKTTETVQLNLITASSALPTSDLKILTSTYSAPQAVYLIFDVDGALIPPQANPDAENQFWHQVLPDALLPALNGPQTPAWVLQAYSRSRCMGVTQTDRRPFFVTSFGEARHPNTLGNTIMQATDCALADQATSVQTADWRLLEGWPEDSVSRLWLIVRWWQSDAPVFDHILSASEVDTWVEGLWRRYGHPRQLPSNNRVVVIVLGRSTDILQQADLVGLIDKLKSKMVDKTQGRASFHFLTLDAENGARIDTIGTDLSKRTEIHVPILLKKLLTPEQAENSDIKIAYSSSSVKCRDISVPLQKAGTGTGARLLGLATMPWVIAGCVVMAFDVVLSLCLYRYSPKFRRRLNQLWRFPWEKTWDN
jgi:hypothetical protein